MQRSIRSIRCVRAEDHSALIELLIALELFEPEEIQEVGLTLRSYFAAQNGTSFWIVDDDPQLGLSGVAYCAPEKMTQGTWNLYLIGVHAHRRGEGRGTDLIKAVEEMAVARGGRVLLVETSGTDDFEKSRSFYSKAGYRKEARIHDFYKDGDDKVVFWKALQK